MDPIIYTNARITTGIIQGVVHIHAIDPVGEVLIVLTRQEFTDGLKSWLRELPVEKRQMFIDELVACTLRTLE